MIDAFSNFNVKDHPCSDLEDKETALRSAASGKRERIESGSR
jgi:hypothetical protein